jgi:carbonic anhydrase
MEHLGYTLKLFHQMGPINITDECNQKHIYLGQEFHFHIPSEHTVEGKLYPFEMHIVHALDGEPLSKYTHCVVGVLFDIADTDSEFITSLDFKNMNVITKMDLQSYIRSFCSEFYMYKGSLTTPPCTECVQWISLKLIQGITKETLSIVKTHLEKYNQCPNARATCPLNGRVVFKNK